MSSSNNNKLNSNNKLNPKLSLNEKLDLILKNQQTILDNEAKILGEEEKILEKEEEIKRLEEEEMSNEQNYHSKEEGSLESLLALQQKLQNESKKSMRKITKKDFFKGFIGAFIGVMSHFAFLKAVSISEDLTFTRATALFIVAGIIIITMLYFTGFKQIRNKFVLNFIPLRATILYGVSIFTILFVNFLFGQIYDYSFFALYNLVAANIILAVIGAGTADLIGRVEED
ncbi:MAG: hypothetical protein LAT82_00510 [Nanoarchaeota archaeon]|nr:hypothetical protein [Nanoarchaeota archaeon]